MVARHTTSLEALLVDDAFDGDVYPHEPMHRHTSYKIGGPARFYVCASSVSALKQLIDACKNDGVDWVIVGKGSNLLVSDEGYDGVVIALGRDFKMLRFDDARNVFLAGAAVALSKVVQEAFKQGLEGMEFAVGTPGTVGGAVCMNAGTGDEWIGDRIVSVTTYSPEKGMRRLLSGDIEWSYRSASILPHEVVLECELAVKESMPSYIRGRMEAILARRKKSQPMNHPSCGSVFKNPPGHSAGELIEGSGMKGVRIGDAQVSEVHANFIVNRGNASAAEVKELIDSIVVKVKQVYGIELQTEVRFLGFA